MQEAAAADAEPHKTSHDIALMRLELTELQKRLDSQQNAFVDSIRAVDKVREYFDTVNQTQEQIRKIAARLDRLDQAVIRLSKESGR